MAQVLDIDKLENLFDSIRGKLKTQDSVAATLDGVDLKFYQKGNKLYAEYGYSTGKNDTSDFETNYIDNKIKDRILYNNLIPINKMPKALEDAINYMGHADKVTKDIKSFEDSKLYKLDSKDFKVYVYNQDKKSFKNILDNNDIIKEDDFNNYVKKGKVEYTTISKKDLDYTINQLVDEYNKQEKSDESKIIIKSEYKNEELEKEDIMELKYIFTTDENKNIIVNPEDYEDDFYVHAVVEDNKALKEALEEILEEYIKPNLKYSFDNLNNIEIKSYDFDENENIGSFVLDMKGARNLHESMNEDKYKEKKFDLGNLGKFNIEDLIKKGFKPIKLGPPSTSKGLKVTGYALYDEENKNNLSNFYRMQRITKDEFDFAENLIESNINESMSTKYCTKADINKFLKSHKATEVAFGRYISEIRGTEKLFEMHAHGSKKVAGTYDSFDLSVYPKGALYREELATGWGKVTTKYYIFGKEVDDVNESFNEDKFFKKELISLPQKDAILNVGDEVNFNGETGEIVEIRPMKMSDTCSYKIKLDNGKTIWRYEEEIINESINEPLNESGNAAYEVNLLKIYEDGTQSIYESEIVMTLKEAKKLAKEFTETKKDSEDLYIGTIEKGRTYWGAKADDFGSGDYVYGISNKSLEETQDILGKDFYSFDDIVSVNESKRRNEGLLDNNILISNLDYKITYNTGNSFSKSSQFIQNLKNYDYFSFSTLHDIILTKMHVEGLKENIDFEERDFIYDSDTGILKLENAPVYDNNYVEKVRIGTINLSCKLWVHPESI